MRIPKIPKFVTGTLEHLERSQFAVQQAVVESSRAIQQMRQSQLELELRVQQSGFIGAQGMQALQLQQQVAQQAAGTTMGWNMAGAAASAIPYAGPILGAVLQGYGQYQTQEQLMQAQIQAQRLQIQDQTNFVFNQIARMSGSPIQSLYGQFGSPVSASGLSAPGEMQPMLTLQSAQAYAMVNNGPVPLGFQSWEAELRRSVAPGLPYGDPNVAMRSIAGMQASARMDFRSMGYDERSFFMQAYGLRDATASEVTAAEMRSRGASEADISRITSSSAMTGRPGGLLSTDRAATVRRMEEDVFLGGEDMAAALRSSLPGDMQGDLTSAVQRLGQFRGRTIMAQAGVSEATRAYMMGDVNAAQKAISGAGGEIAEIAGVAKSLAYNPDGTVRRAEALQLYEQLAGQQLGAAQQAAQMAYGGQAVGIAGAYGAGRLGMAQFAAYGDVSGLMTGAANIRAGISGDIAREQQMMSQNIWSPEQRAASIERQSSLREQEIQILERVVTSLNRMNEAVGQTGTNLATGAFQRAIMGGAGGTEFVQGGLGVASRIGSQIQGVSGKLAARETQLRNMGRDPSTFMNDFEYLRLANTQNQLATEQEQMLSSLISGPASVGIRRSEQAMNFEIGVLQQLPGTYGSLTGALRRGINTLQGDIDERGRMREQMMGSGVWNEQRQLEYEQYVQSRQMQQVGMFGQLSYGWEARIPSQFVNTPGNVSFAAPFLSMMAAVSSGVENPMFGSNRPMPSYLRTLGSLAGSTGTAEGMGVTGVTGVAPNANFDSPYMPVYNLPGAGSSGDLRQVFAGGIRVVIEETGEDGTTRYRNGTAYINEGTRSDTSPAAMAEINNILRVR